MDQLLRNSVLHLASKEQITIVICLPSWNLLSRLCQTLTGCVQCHTEQLKNEVSISNHFPEVHTHTYTHTHTHTHAHIHTETHTQTHTLTYTDRDTKTQTETHRHRQRHTDTDTRFA